ncbi:MAG: oxidoreductase [Actinomycetota bacterium]|jgi:hypothetical protein|nr:oxidoreductase [Actinomycetota bacterium]
MDRFKRRNTKPGGPPASAQTQAKLTDFMATRDGVEAFVEPPTAIYAMTVCLVAADGEYLRQPVRDERHARKLCSDHGVPLYDARIVGYPRRMRDYERGVRQQTVGLDELPPLDVIDERERRDD